MKFRTLKLLVAALTVAGLGSATAFALPQAGKPPSPPGKPSTTTDTTTTTSTTT